MNGELSDRGALAVALCAVTLAIAGAQPVRMIAPPSVEFFDGRAVTLLPGPFLDARYRDEAVLLAIEPDRLLHTFRSNAGLASAAAPYGGWEAPGVELRGHSIGHYLTACARLYAYTGNSVFKERTQYLVRSLDEVQRALERNGATPGYLSAFPESFIDRVERRERVWAPYYTLHKIMAGLLDAAEWTDDPTALQVVSRMADWVERRMARLTKEQQQQMLQTEFGGMPEVLARLAFVSGTERYLRLAQVFDHEALLGPLKRGVDSLDGLHGNTQFPKLLGAMVEYELTGDQEYLRAAEFFWERVAHHRSFVIGGNTNDEGFFPVGQFSVHLGPASTETCNSYNMIRLSASLFRHEPSGRTMDFVERALFNHILASQDPSTGMVCYYVPLKPGVYKTYSTPDSSFWCCVGTGMENPVRTVETIYAHNATTLYVNQFISSEVQWEAASVGIRQETAFPTEGRTRLEVKTKERSAFRIAVRHPAWARRGFRITVNGGDVHDSSSPGTYAFVDRVWSSGDVVTVEMPMDLSVESMPDDRSVVAILHGPIVLAGDLGAVGEDSREYGPEAPDVRGSRPVTIPALVAENTTQALANVSPTPNRAGAFRTTGLGDPYDVSLIPFYQVFHRRYTVYWSLRDRTAQLRWKDDEHARTLRRADEFTRTVDVVYVDRPASEREHGYASAGASDHWYDARRGRQAFNGWFRYTLATHGADSVALLCLVQGNDGRRRAFEVFVGETAIASEDLSAGAPGFVEKLYPIPASQRQGRDSVTVTFRSGPDMLTGALFELRLLRANTP